jgi:multidrug efflux system membrane fusion protein
MNLKKKIQDRPWILAVLVTLIVALWMYSGSISRDLTNKQEMQAAAAAPQAVAGLTRVRVSQQIAGPIVRFISVYGSTAPARSVELNTETDGRVVSIEARRGEMLKKGAVILRLDLRDREARLRQARASVKEHKTAYDGQMKLKADGYVSETQIAETQARLETARAEMIRAELDIEYMTIRAPFDGVLQDREVEVGDFVRSGDIVATFIDNTRIIVTGTIAEQDEQFVAVDNIAQAELVTGENVEGRIRYIAPVADASTRTFTVEMEVPNPDGKLPAGITAEMFIPTEEVIAQKLSPSLLTLDSAGAIGVKTVDEYNRVVFSEVTIIRSESNGVWVTGLPETATVIIVGQGYVLAGQEVTPVADDSETALAAEKLR